MELSGGLKIGWVSRRTGVSAATLRLWEDQYGLLTPARTPSGQRLYSETDVERVLYIHELITSRGYSLQGVATILAEARVNMPATVEEVLVEEPGTPESRHLAQLATQLRAYLEDAYLRVATSRDQIREGQLLAQIHSIVSRVARSTTFTEAATKLVAETDGLIGNQHLTLGRYDSVHDVLHWIATARDGRLRDPAPNPWPVSWLVPAAFLQAFRERQPYYVRRIPVDELPPEAAKRVVAGGTQSFYAHPLTAGTTLVGLLIVTSRRVDGVSTEARSICARVAAIAGPALAYLADQERLVTHH